MFPSGSISRNDYITAKKKCFARLVKCRKLREFRRYLLPGGWYLVVSRLFAYSDLHTLWIRLIRLSTFVTDCCSERDLSPPPFSYIYFSWIFLRKRISSTLSPLLPFYTLSRRRWDNRRHRLFSSQFIEACFNVKIHPCWLASFKLYVPLLKSGEGGFYVWPEAARALIDWIRHGIGR